MRNARSERRIKSVNVERDVDRRVEFELEIIEEIFHLDDFDAESLDLFALMSSRRADTDLDEPFDQPFFHNSRERAGVRVAVALKFVVDVRVRVEMQDAQTRVFPCEGFDDGIRDRVISAERDGAVVLIE